MRYIEQLQKNAGRDSARISRIERENAELRAVKEIEAGQLSNSCTVGATLEPDYRTRLLHEYAGRAMQGMFSKDMPVSDIDILVHAVRSAKELVAQLEKEGLL